MKELTPEKQREITFNACRAYNLHLRSSEARRDIVQALSEVAKSIDEFQKLEKPERYDDLRVINDEYIASYSYIGTPLEKYLNGFISFFRESGITELKFAPQTPESNDIDCIPSYKTIENFRDTSMQSDGSLLTKRLYLDPQYYLLYISTENNQSVKINAACPCFSYYCPIDRFNIEFQPSNYLQEAFTEVTGLPIIKGDFTTETQDTSNQSGHTFTPSIDDPEHAYYLSWHRQYQHNNNGYPIKSSDKSVVFVHKDKQAFLDGDEPLIIVFLNIDGHNEVYRRLPNGSYIVNSSIREKSNIFPYDLSYNTLSYQEIVDKSESLIQPNSDTIISAAKGEFEKVIPQKYMDLYKEVLEKIGPDGQSTSVPEDDEPIY